MAGESNDTGQKLNDVSEQWDPNISPHVLKYAWDWFSYHANQRLTAFHYFLIIVGILATGYATSFEKDLYLLQAVLGSVGVLISAAFLALDVRNTELVDDARKELWKLEGALGMKEGIYRMDENGKHEKRPKRRWKVIPISHSFWLRTIEFITLILFLVAALVGIDSCKVHGTHASYREYRVRPI
jgi:hypothetical protein